MITKKQIEDAAPMNPQEIAEYIHSEFTPYSRLGYEEAKVHLAEMIQRYADWYRLHSIKTPDLTKGGLVGQEFIPE